MYEAFFLRAQALATNSNSMFFAQYDLPTHKHFFHILILDVQENIFKQHAFWHHFLVHPQF
jgi:hypothetical protein